jgi:hypothetical protein
LDLRKWKWKENRENSTMRSFMTFTLHQVQVGGYLLTPWNTVLLEKLTGSQLVKKFHAFYGTRRFMTAFTTAHHLSLS